jgi:hypothetical protein
MPRSGGVRNYVDHPIAARAWQVQYPALRAYQRAAMPFFLFREDKSHRSSLSGHSLHVRASCRKDWLSVRKEALVCPLADGASSARDPTAPSALTDPGLVLVRAGLADPLGREEGFGS